MHAFCSLSKVESIYVSGSRSPASGPQVHLSPQISMILSALGRTLTVLSWSISQKDLILMLGELPLYPSLLLHISSMWDLNCYPNNMSSGCK